MRITQNIFYASSQSYVQDGLSRIFQTQRDIGTGVRIHRPSDDPAGTERLLSLNRRLRDITQYTDNAVRGRSFVDTSASTLENISDVISSAREAIIQGKSGAIEDSVRQTIVSELTGHIEDLLSLANTKVGNRFLFAGTASDALPFEITADAQGRERVRYFGNSDRISAQIGPNTQGALNLPGDEVFAVGQRGTTRYEGLTGAAPGTGTDNGTGIDEITVYHGTTTINGASGVQVGTDSAALDTIVGPTNSHSLEIKADADGLGGKIRLNGGPPFDYTNPETNLQVEGPDGELVHLDTTGIIAGFDSVVNLFASGEISVDGGQTRVPLDFSGNQQVRDQDRDIVLNVDTTNVRRAGAERVEYPGTFDVFSSLISIRDALSEVGQNDSLAADNDRLNSLLEELDKSTDRVLSSIGRLGTLSARLESAESRLLEIGTRVRGLKSDVEDTDFAEATAQLQASQTSYQAALLLTSRVSELSLLNYI